MFTSISRGSSRARPSYICTSCLTSILGHADAQLPGQTSERQPFTSSATNHARISRTAAGPGRRRSAIPISSSKDALDALKQSLLDDITPPKKQSKEKKTLKASSTIKHAGVTNSPGKAENGDSANKVNGTKNVGKVGKAATVEKDKDAKKGKNSATAKEAESKEDILKSASSVAEAGEAGEKRKESKTVKKKKQGKGGAAGKQTEASNSNEKNLAAAKSQKTAADGSAKSQRNATRKGLTAKITGTSAGTKGRKLTIRRESGKPYIGALIRKAASEPKSKIRSVMTHVSSLPYENYDLEAHIRRAGADATRDALVKVIGSGHLSPIATLDAVRNLRASLVKRIPSGPTDGQGFVPKRIADAMKAYSNMKDGIQHRSRQGPLASDRPLVGGKPLQPQPTTQSGIARRVPKPQKAVKTGPMKGKGFDVKSITANELHLTPVEKAQERVPSLAYGLDRVLFNPGVYHLQDPRSRVFNFDPYLQTIMPVNEFDFNALKQYITSSRDETLLGITREQNKKYTGSTSSMNAALGHFHFLLSQWRPVNFGMLSQNFPIEFNSFTALQRSPTAIFLRRRDGVYAIDADKQYDTANILSMLGKSMEKLLTLPTSDFEKYRKENSDQITEEERNEAETFNYTTIGDFLLRSQLDAFDPRLPGSGMFDLKTRAVVSIRMDTKEYEKGMGYEIRGRHGEWESYEREYYDMIRAAFLKYSLQVRMGRMDGIFVAFHNTERIFGFQYISLPEMDYALHGTEDTTIGDSEFKLSLELLNKVLDRATKKYPDKSIRLHFETRGDETPFMYIFAEPMDEPEIDEIQASNHAKVLEFEQRVLGLNQKTEEELLEEKKNAEWEVLRAKVETSMEKDEMGIPEARAIAEDIIQESEYWDELSPDEKEERITELLKSFDFGETLSEKQSEPVVFDDGEVDGDEDAECNEIEEDDTNEKEEEDEEGEETGIEDSRVESDLEIAEDAEKMVDESNQGLEENGDMDEEIDDPAFEESQEDGDLETTEDAEDEAVDGTSLVKEVSDLEGNDAELDEAETSEGLEQVEGTPDQISPITPINENKSGEKAPTEVFAMTLTIRNLVNGQYVERPENLSAKDKWTVEYALVDIAKERGETIYEACKQRRYQALSSAKREVENPWNNAYLANLRKLSNEGKAWRQGQDKIDVAAGLKILEVKDEGNGLWSEGKKE